MKEKEPAEELLKRDSERLPRRIVQECRFVLGDETPVDDENWEKIKISAYNPFSEIWTEMAKYGRRSNWGDMVEKFKWAYMDRVQNIPTTPEAYVTILPRAIQLLTVKYKMEYYNAAHFAMASLPLSDMRRFGIRLANWPWGKDFWEAVSERFPATYIRQRYLWLKAGVDIWRKSRKDTPTIFADFGCSIGVGVQSTLLARKNDWESPEMEIKVVNAPEEKAIAEEQRLQSVLQERAINNPISVYKYDRSRPNPLWAMSSAFPRYLEKVIKDMTLSMGIDNRYELENAGSEWVIRDVTENLGEEEKRRIDMGWISVMLYLLEPEQRQKALSNLKQALVPGGVAFIVDAEGCMDTNLSQKELQANLYRDRGTKLYAVVAGYKEKGAWQAEDSDRYPVIELGTYYATGGNTTDACAGLELDWQQVQKLEELMKGTTKMYNNYKKYNRVRRARK